ncbi:MAG: ABC transporter substrate-binding protein [Candidatus Roizmanbacteria bacterium]
MNKKNNPFRYFYWLFIEYSKKHLKLFLLSFLLSIITFFGIVSLSPYLINYITTRRDIIGLVGNYDINSLPDIIVSQFSNRLVFINEKGDIVPILAESWEYLNNGKEYRFHIRKDLIWSNGSKFTARDLDYKFKDIETQIVDDYLIIFKLKAKLPVFPTYLTRPIIKKPLLGVAGLYRVERIKSQFGNVKEVYLTPQKTDLPILIYKIFDSETKMINAYKLGEINQMIVMRKPIVDIFSSWNNTKIEKTVDYGSLLTLFINQKNQFLQEKDVRHAIAMSIPAEKLQEQGEQAVGPIPPISWAYNVNIKNLQTNPDMSIKLLKKYQDASSSATLNFVTYNDQSDLAEQIKKSFDSIGLKTKINIASFEDPSGFDLFLASWKVPYDPDQYFFWHSKQIFPNQFKGNITGFNSQRVDRLLERGRDTMNIAERKSIYYDFQRTMMDEMPAIFLYYPYVYKIKRK